MKPMYPHEHEKYNATHYPGTRQLCAFCDQPTGRCEEDAIYLEDGQGPLCEECRDKSLTPPPERTER